MQFMVGLAILIDRCSVVLHDVSVGRQSGYIQVKYFWPLTVAETVLAGMMFAPHWTLFWAYALPTIAICGVLRAWLIGLGIKESHEGKSVRLFGRSEVGILMFRCLRTMDLLLLACLFGRYLPNG